jgi:hypothetical protein
LLTGKRINNGTALMRLHGFLVQEPFSTARGAEMVSSASWRGGSSAYLILHLKINILTRISRGVKQPLAPVSWCIPRRNALVRQKTKIATASNLHSQSVQSMVLVGQEVLPHEEITSSVL